MIECDKQEDIYYLIYALLSENLDLVAIDEESAINEAKEHFYLLREDDYENAEIKKMYAIVDYPEPGVTHTRGYLLLDKDWDVEF